MATSDKNTVVTQKFIDKLIDTIAKILKEQHTLIERDEKQEESIELLLEKVSLIENNFEELTKSLAHGSYPLKLARSIRAVESSLSPKIIPIAISKFELVATYNEIVSLLLAYIIPVAFTSDSYRNLKSDRLFLETTIKGNYWAITTIENKQQKYWLVPNSNIKFNIHKLKTVKNLFQLKGDYDSSTSEFILQEPAVLSLLPDNKQWELIQSGVLFFGKELKSVSSLNQSSKNKINYQSKIDNQIQSALTTFQTKVEQLSNQIVQLEIQSKIFQKTYQREKQSWSEQFLLPITQNLFLPELTFIDIEDALPGGYLPPETQPLIFNNSKITLLLPFNSVLLNHFTPEDLINRINITPLDSSNESLIRIELNLPWLGINNRLQNQRIYKDYLLKEENALAEGVPILEVWPHFQAEGWQEYYGFYYDAGLGEDTFHVSFPQAKEPHVYQQGRGNYQLTKLDKFPDYIRCHDVNDRDLGLILLKAPPRIDLTGSWRVGVDFGTSFTNIYVNRKGTVEPLSLESLHHKVTEADIETRIPVLFEYFIPENFIPLEKPLPFANVLTTRGKTNCAEGKEKALFDGRIYIPDNSDRFRPNNDWIKTVKWDDWLHCRLFLEHLAIIISAMAASKGIKEIQWALSCPGAFSKSDRLRYIKTWQELTKNLQKRTAIKQICPEQDDLNYFRPECIAFAQYFVDRETYDLVRSTCIKIDNDISDISIWENNELVHQCSVRLAGRQLISQFFEVNTNFLCKSFQENPEDWKGLKQERFYAKLDVLLRHKGEQWLKEKIKNFDKDPEFQSLVRLIALGTAGLYYYVGILLKVLHAEGKYSADEITPTYVGGNGSRLLNWLDNSGEFDRSSEINELFSYMLSRGSGFEDTEEKTRLSQKPKDEVACGLVLSDTRLKGLTAKQQDPLIAGEVCEINGEKIEYDSRLEWEDTIKDFKIPELGQLFTFVDEFNLGIQELKLEDLKPMPQHQRGKGLEPKYKEQLCRKTRKELDAMLLKEFNKGDAEDIRPDAPFIFGLKALLRVLAKEWAGQ